MNSIIFVEDLIRIHEHNTQYSFTMSNVEMMNRRKFIRTGVAGVAGLSLAQVGWADIQRVLPSDVSVDKVKLGNTGLEVSRIALGTGTKGWNYESNQTRIGLDNFVKLAHHGYERGGTGFLPEAVECFPDRFPFLRTLVIRPHFCHQGDLFTG